MKLNNWLNGSKCQHLSPVIEPGFEHIQDLSGGCGFHFSYAHLIGNFKKN
jgi:hypothetical protein